MRHAILRAPARVCHPTRFPCGVTEQPPDCDRSELERIIQEYLLGGRLVSEFCFHDAPLSGAPGN